MFGRELQKATYQELFTYISIKMFFFTESSPDCVMGNEGPTYLEGQNVALNCSVGYYGNVTPTLRWHAPTLLQGHLDYSVREYSHVSTKNIIKENVITSVMNVTLRRMIDGKIFTCNIEFPGTVTTYSCITSFPPQSVQCKFLLYTSQVHI